MARPHPAVWLGDRPRRRPRLSEERIVQAAVALLDAEGVQGFSMRRLAARLGAATMSLYEYVATKEDLFDLALDAAMGEIELPADRPPAWREELTHHAVQSRRVMRRHPWMTELVGTRPLLGPNALARSERFHAALAAAGFAGAELVAAAGAVSSYVHGYVVTENVWRARMRDPAEERELRRRAQSYLAGQPDRYPVLAEHARLEDADFDAGFRSGLELILDGIATRLAP
ncbi:TetR/AcrR family transcriptional regulator [Marinitenerispora sediminis]|uniref:TetR family transcriptional regulator n=1 Tax=Marinitenerispora sediminis TaxID=1931232 RepID=A0A368TAB4_9ACTN|nr:TetR/AcrR family transcriptional regulator [Marinitenerispora sediminis]RCV47916.1 TetR family transcriptional regulator [Marinitenerispora sediminis]RCV53402.1 TetR family transcriptional regulator [Marinitenerispora sediminis]RCV61817.1 TetR family transcriptional regulator [Marinitenerispora sediminis]